MYVMPEDGQYGRNM